MNRTTDSAMGSHATAGGGAASRLRAAVASIASRRQDEQRASRARDARLASLDPSARLASLDPSARLASHIRDARLAATMNDAPPAAGAPPRGDVMSLSPAARWLRALGALAKVVVDPRQTDQVLEFAMYANAGTMARRIEQIFEDPRYRRLYEERRAIDSKTIDLERLGRLPEGTLGRAYADFMRSRGLTLEVFDDAPREVADPRAVYVIQRLRQTHDLWHVVTGLETDPAGEIALQAFTFAQVRAPSALILALVGTLQRIHQRPALRREVAAAFRAGRRAEKLALFPWEDHWETPLAEVRALLGVRPPARASA